ncbi:MAG: hypothetical protein E7254_01220 [Lachnospiraceae bacterium]|nr:hypothetical protein [Lachnospiraceae bacterium]
MRKNVKKALAISLAGVVFVSGFATEKGAVKAADGNVPEVITTEYDEGTITINWNDVNNAQSYNVYRAKSRFGNYEFIANTNESKFTDTTIGKSKYENYYKVKAVGTNFESDYSKPASLEIQMFGENTYVFSDGDNRNDINTVTENVFSKQRFNQFGKDRYLFAYKKGDYTNTDTVNIGYYTQMMGLGKTPYDVKIRNVKTPSALGEDSTNATCNFWVGIENLLVADTDHNDDVYFGFQWAVSQAAPARRLYVERNAVFDWYWGWASGGYVADSYFEKAAGSYSQQQYYYRNCYINDGAYGINWNKVIQGCTGNTVNTAGMDSLKGTNGKTDWGYNKATTIIDNTDKLREKPFLYFDETDDEYKVFVPSLKYNTSNVSWSFENMGDGISLRVSDSFYIANAKKDTADTINEQLKAGKNIIFSPGVYYVDKPLEVKYANTIVLGLGLATIIPNNDVAAMKVADVGGVSICGLIFDAGNKSEELLEVGPKGCNKNHDSNPTVLQDVFYRVGGTGELGRCGSCLVINSNDVIVDHTWIWRADHGNNTGWYANTAKNGMVVNGDNIITYGLFCEHFQEYDILWRGENGKTYFLQNEKCYDPQKQEEWRSHDDTVDGYASYKVANNVKKHYAVGLGMYDVFIYTNGASIHLENAIEVPNSPDVLIENACIVEIANGNGPLVGINHIINGTGCGIRTGAGSGGGYAVQRLLSYQGGQSVAIDDYYRDQNTTAKITEQGAVMSNDDAADVVIEKENPSVDDEIPVWNMTDELYMKRIESHVGNEHEHQYQDGIEITDKLKVDGMQINMTAMGIRTIYSTADRINGHNVEEVGLVYGIEDEFFNVSDMYVGSNSASVASFVGTENKGRMKYVQSLDRTYAMTMMFAYGIKEEYSSVFYVRAYAKLDDGSYIYSTVERYSAYTVAEKVYSEMLSGSAEIHNAIYEKIIRVVNPDYQMIDYIK